MKQPKEILKSEKGIKIIFAAGIALIIIIFLFGTFGSERNEKAEEGEKNVLSEIDEYERHLEARLSEIIGEIQGTRDISVMITLENLLRERDLRFRKGNANRKRSTCGLRRKRKRGGASEGYGRGV